MPRNQCRWVVGCLILVTLVASGCGQGPPSLSGVVTLDGKPLEGATITLHPEKERGSELVVGTTGPDGSFTITPSAGKWIALGKYKMTISKRAEPTPEDQRALRVPPETLPDKYSNLAKSELSVTVPADKDITLNLTSK